MHRSKPETKTETNPEITIKLKKFGLKKFKNKDPKEKPIKASKAALIPIKPPKYISVKNPQSIPKKTQANLFSPAKT